MEGSPIPAGRPVEFTENVILEIEESLQLGVSRRVASEAAGFDYSTLKVKCESDPELSARFTRAEGVGITQAAACIRKAMMDPGQFSSASVQAAKFYLATRRQDAWREESKVTHSGNVGIFQAAASTIRDKAAIDEEPSGE